VCTCETLCMIRFGDAFKPDDAAELDALQLKELKNGRLAMVSCNQLVVKQKCHCHDYVVGIV
jgi:Chlorophyll A-B binding protein